MDKTRRIQSEAAHKHRLAHGESENPLVKHGADVELDLTVEEDTMVI